MKSDLSHSPSPSLQLIEAKFEEWRANNTRRTRIPEHLWQQALGLVNHYSLNKIKQALKLSTSQMKARFPRSPDKNPLKTNKSPTFIPINIPHPHSEMNSPLTGKIEIKRSDGITLILCGFSEHTLTQILINFTRER